MKIEELKNEILDYKSNILLIGEVGKGKTTIMAKLCHEFIKEENISPLYIPLYAYDGKENFIKRFILKNFLGDVTYGLDSDSAEELLVKFFRESTRTYVLFVDGIDEAISYATGDIYFEINEFVAIENMIVVAAIGSDTVKLDDFVKIRIGQLDTGFLANRIPQYVLLNEKLKTLLHIPCYCSQYIQLTSKNDENNINAPMLMRAFYEEQIAKLSRTLTAVRQDGYYDYVKLVIKSFLPYVCSRLVEINDLSFDEVVCDKLYNRWKEKLTTTEKSVVEYPYSYIDVWKKFGIITFNDTKWHIEEFNRDYFAAEIVVDYINRDIEILKYGNDLMQNGNVVRYIGELLGEDNFEYKTDIYGVRSPIECLLDNYRNIEGQSDVISRFITIMKTCRNKRITADYSGLDLTDTTFFDCDISNSKFEKSRMSQDCIYSCNIDSLICGALFRERDVIAYGGYGTIYKLSIENGISKCVKSHSDGSQIRAGALINNAKYAVTSTWQDIVVTDLENMSVKCVLKHHKHKKTVTCITTSPDDKEFVTVSEDCATIWSVKTRKILKTIHLDIDYDLIKNNVQFVNDRKILFVNKNNDIMEYNLNTDKVDVFFEYKLPVDETIIAIRRDNYYGNILIITTNKIYVYKEEYLKNAKQLLYSGYCVGYDFSNAEIMGIDFYNSMAVITTNEVKSVLVWIENDKIYQRYSGLYPLSLFGFPKLLENKILHVGMFGHCSIFNLDLTEERKIREISLLTDESLIYIGDHSLCFVEGSVIKILDLQSMRCKKTLSFSGVVSGRTKVIIDGVTYLIFSIVGENKIFYYNFKTEECSTWEYQSEHAVASSIDVSLDGKSLLLCDAENYQIWDISELDNPKMIKQETSNAYKCFFVGRTVLEHDCHMQKIRMKAEQCNEFDTHDSAPVFNFILKNGTSQCYVDYDFCDKTIWFYCGADLGEKRVSMKVNPNVSVYKCGTDMFCILDEGHFKFYQLDKSGIPIHKEHMNLYLAEYKDLELHHKHLLLCTIEGSLIIYDNSTMKFYNIKNGKKEKKQVELLPNINVYNADFSHAKFIESDRKFFNKLKNSGAII